MMEILEIPGLGSNFLAQVTVHILVSVSKSTYLTLIQA